MTRRRFGDAGAGPAERVTPVEIFFDLVFAFTLTQLAGVLEDDLSPAGAGRVVLLFGILWWMYTGYVWLTNHVPPRRASQKLLLFAAMAGLLVSAVVAPRAFGETGVVFGLGYLVVISIHLILFTQYDFRGVLRLAPFNLAAALLVLTAGLVDGAAVYILWAVAFILQAVVPYLVPNRSWVGVAQSFHLSAGHFVERHGLLVIVALGESVIAIGMAVDISHLTATTVGVIVLALALPGAIWWTYFTDVPAAERALADAEPGRRTRLAARTYVFVHITLLLGVVVAVAGLHAAVAHPAGPAEPASAVALAGGIALFLAGAAGVRVSLAIGPPVGRLVAAVAALATIPLAVTSSTGLQLAALVAVVVAMLLLDRKTSAPEAHESG